MSVCWTDSKQTIEDLLVVMKDDASVTAGFVNFFMVYRQQLSATAQLKDIHQPLDMAKTVISSIQDLSYAALHWFQCNYLCMFLERFSNKSFSGPRNSQTGTAVRTKYIHNYR